MSGLHTRLRHVASPFMAPAHLPYTHRCRVSASRHVGWCHWLPWAATKLRCTLRGHRRLACRAHRRLAVDARMSRDASCVLVACQCRTLPVLGGCDRMRATRSRRTAARQVLFRTTAARASCCAARRASALSPLFRVQKCMTHRCGVSRHSV